MLVLKLNIHVTGKQEVHSPSGTARMILFDGDCEGPYFRGVIEPGGVDTQIIAPDGRGTLSARYSLQGMDREGRPARMFIENNAVLGRETHPRIWTDSPCLQWLETAALRGQIVSGGGKLTILIEGEE